VLASADRETSQLENGILPLVRDIADLSAIALPGLCVALEALVARSETYFAVLRPLRLVLGPKLTMRDTIHPQSYSQ
jgi:hypothetical protein